MNSSPIHLSLLLGALLLGSALAFSPAVSSAESQSSSSAASYSATSKTATSKTATSKTATSKSATSKSAIKVAPSKNTAAKGTAAKRTTLEHRSTVPAPIGALHIEEKTSEAAPAAIQKEYQGWDYLAQKLIAAGTSETEVASIFSDPRMPPRTPVPFKLKPRETKQMYSSFTTEPRLKIARECLSTNHLAFESAEKTFHVSKYVLAALILIETHCGKIVGDNLIVNRLARVASVGEPKNITFNLELLKKEDPSTTREQVEERAAYLEKTFFPDLQAVFEVAERKNMDIFELKGSVAGAFGIPQFLPSSYLKFGIDGNHDGKVWLFDPEDAIPSAAHFLQFFGWKEHGTVEERKQTLWSYNRSEAYGDAVLKVAILLKQPPVVAPLKPIVAKKKSK